MQLQKKYTNIFLKEVRKMIRRIVFAIFQMVIFYIFAKLFLINIPIGEECKQNLSNLKDKT